MQKREKRKWLFRKSNNHVPAQQCEEKIATTDTITSTIAAPVSPTMDAKKRHAIAAEAAAAEAEAVNIARLAREIWAAIVIQTAFRGYLVSYNLLYIAQFNIFMSFFVGDLVVLIEN